jgi:two-component system NtrC family sensor kinase
MRLYQKLILFTLAATLVPLIVGFVVLKHSEQQLQKRLLQSREESAARQAEVVSREIGEVLKRVRRALGYFTVEQMSPEELAGFLGILYKQSEDIVQVALLDESGKELAPGVYLDHPEQYPEYAGRLGVKPEDHLAFMERLPLQKARQVSLGSVVLSTAYKLPQADTLGISFVIPWQVPEREDRWFAAVELSLDWIIGRLLETGGTRGFKAIMVDSAGKVIAHPDPLLVNSRKDLSKEPAVARVVSGVKRGAFVHAGAVWGFAAVPDLGWGVIISQSRAEAWAEVRRTRRVTVIGTSASILALLILGGLFTGRITRNLRRFVASAEEFAKGNLDARVELKARDELGVLARTFNHMGAELKASREEIEEWNRELARRVEERTRELEEAHRRLLETSKLAAIGQLGAGVAHEINNPLVGILGNIQLMLLKSKGDEKQQEILKKVEIAAKRCKEITQNLLRFSEQEADPEHVEVDLHEILQDAYSMTEQRIQAQQIETVWELEPELPHVLGDHRQLMQVFFNLFSNARTAMETGGKLVINSRWSQEGGVEVEVRDTGKGIPPEHLQRVFEPFFTTKDVWTNTGLGLSVAYRIISDHGGRIAARSEVGKGSAFTITLPAGGERA